MISIVTTILCVRYHYFHFTHEAQGSGLAKGIHHRLRKCPSCFSWMPGLSKTKSTLRRVFKKLTEAERLQATPLGGSKERLQELSTASRTHQPVRRQLSSAVYLKVTTISRLPGEEAWHYEELKREYDQIFSTVTAMGKPDNVSVWDSKACSHQEPSTVKNEWSLMFAVNISTVCF